MINWFVNKQVAIVVLSVQNNTVYTLKLNNIEYTYTSSNSATIFEICSGLSSLLPVTLVNITLDSSNNRFIVESISQNTPIDICIITTDLLHQEFLTLDVKEVFCKWALYYSGLNPATDNQKVIWLNQSGEKPSYSFITLNILARIASTRDEVHYDNSSNSLCISGLRKITLNVKTYGKQALFLIENLEASLKAPDVINFFNDNNISFIESVGAVNIAALLNDTYEDRWSIDFYFYIANNVFISNEYIESIAGIGTLSGSTEEHIIPFKTEI